MLESSDSSVSSQPDFAQMSKDELWRLACDRRTAHAQRRAAIRQWLVLEESERSKLATQVIKEAQQAGLASQQRGRKEHTFLRIPGDSSIYWPDQPD